MKTLIILTIISSAIDALSQLREVPVDYIKSKKQYVKQSWIPNVFFEWNFNKVPVIGRVLDAFHQYQGWGLFLFGVSLVNFYRTFWGIFVSVIYKLNLNFYIFDINIAYIYLFLFLAGYALIWYQFRNLFFHIVFKYPKYWKNFNPFGVK